MSADDVIKAHVKALKEGGFVLKLDTLKPGCGEQISAAGRQVSCQMSASRENVCPGGLFVPQFEALTRILTFIVHPVFLKAFRGSAQ